MRRALRTIVVDDEPLALDLMESILADIPRVKIVGRCSSGREACQLVERESVDLMLLDVQMPGMSGFEVVARLQGDNMPAVVFATAYDAYALKAFDLHAVDYLLKPLDPERVRMAIERTRHRITANEHHKSKAPLIKVIDDLTQQNADLGENFGYLSMHKLPIRDYGMVDLVDFDDIDWVDAAGDYMCVHVGEKTHVMRSTMKALERMLPGNMFARVHRSTLVNLCKVSSIESLPKGEFLLALKNGNQVKVSRSYRKAVASLL